MHSFLQVIVKRLVSTIRLQSWGLIECIDNEIYGNSTTGSHGITDILLGIYAKRSIQIYILIFSFIFLSEIVCSVVRICIQIFVYFSDFFFFYYSHKNCVNVRHGTSDLLPLRRHVPAHRAEPNSKRPLMTSQAAIRYMWLKPLY